MKYSIRKATKDDIEELLSISTRVTNHNTRQYLPDDMVNSFMKSESFTREITDNISLMQVLVSDNKIIGMCT